MLMLSKCKNDSKISLSMYLQVLPALVPDIFRADQSCRMSGTVQPTHQGIIENKVLCPRIPQVDGVPVLTRSDATICIIVHLITTNCFSENNLVRSYRMPFGHCQS